MKSLRIPLLSLSLLMAAPSAFGQWDCNNPISGPDVIVGSLNGICNWGTVGGRSSYSFGATACNVGDVEMIWQGNTNHHPIISPNIFRLKDGRFEQIALGWMKHGFGSATENLCCNCQDPGTSQIIGVGCADTYANCQNGWQNAITSGGNLVSGIGPRSDINPVTGAFAWPYTLFNDTGNDIYKRPQPLIADLEPSQNAGARYYAEVHYITPDEGAIAKHYNNASHREMVVDNFLGGPQMWDLDFIGGTLIGEPGLFAWQNADATVLLDNVEDAEGGRFWVGSNAYDNLDGTWDYEYALYNMNSRIGANSISIPTGGSISNVGFHDVETPDTSYSTVDWPGIIGAGTVDWATGSGANANAIRWGTVFNFRFTSDQPPTTGQVTIGEYLAGGTLNADAKVPDGNACGTSMFCSTAPNSFGAGELISASGSTSVTANNMSLTTIAGVPGEFGLFYYGTTAINTLFGDGFRCVGGLTTRLNPPQTSDVFGDTTRPLDFNSAPMNAGSGMITPGSTWYFQHWYRDPGGSGGSGFNLSAGISAVFCP
jgi:hypothetical protein